MAHRTSEPIARPFCLLALVALALLASPASASTHHSSFINQLTNQPTSQPTNRPSTQLAADLELATTYAPILSFHERERYRPQSIDVMLDHARLRQTVAGVEVTVLDKVTAGDLATAPADTYLDLWYGQDDTSGYLNYTAHGSFYDLNNLRDAYPTTVYARVVRAGDGRVAIQYWLFYYYNDWYNKHEGDWEMVQVELDASSQPTRAVYAQHHGGTLRPWSAVRKEGTHPRAYVALGSHATYFAPGTLYPQGSTVGQQRIEVYDRTGYADGAMPQIVMISDSDPTWPAFAGRWGERAFGDFSGPSGPSQKGNQWLDPFTWADRQPSDAATWYDRNVRAEIAALPSAALLTLSNAPGADPIVESRPPWQVIVVYDLPGASSSYDLRLQSSEALSPTLIVRWPDVGAETIARREYPLALTAGSAATMSLCQTCDFVLDLDANGDGAPDRRVPPAKTTSQRVQYDPPESVVFYLPLGQIVGGVLLAALAAIVPTAVYAFGVWWVDRYEKEPIKLLLATFLWGAIPGALVAVAARFLVAGALAPVITESIKAVAILIIFTRYRREFDDILDGIVYGALSGIGFSMTTNLIAYVVGFFYGGFDFLRASVLLNGIAFGLNEAYYGAVIGIGFGVSRWAADRRTRRFAPWIGLAIAIGLHLLNDFFRDAAVGDRAGLVIVPLAGTWAGIVAVIGIAILSVRREQATIRAHLKAEVEVGTFAQAEYQYLSTPAGRSKMVIVAARRGPAEAARAIRLQTLATRLAYRRRELAILNQDPRADHVAARLRQRIVAVRATHGARKTPRGVLRD